MNALTC